MLKPGQERVPKPRRAAAALCLAACLTTSGCFFGSKKKAARVYTPQPVVAKVPPTPTEIPTNTPAPEVEIAPTPIPNPPEVAIDLPPAYRPPPAKPQPAKPQPPVIVETQPPPSTPPAKPVTVMSAQQQRQMTQQYEGHMSRARNALARIEGRNLPQNLAEDAKTARNYFVLAEQERAGDLPTAVSLAERAERFAMDLLARLP